MLNVKRGLSAKAVFELSNPFTFHEYVLPREKNAFITESGKPVCRILCISGKYRFLFAFKKKFEEINRYTFRCIPREGCRFIAYDTLIIGGEDV